MTIDEIEAKNQAAIPAGQLCEYEGCDRPATEWICAEMEAHRGEYQDGFVCFHHYQEVFQYDEYVHTCPHCGCKSGV